MALTRRLYRARYFLIGGIAVLTAALVLPAVAGAAPGEPKPQSIAAVTAKLAALSRANEALAEQYNGANIAVAQQQKAADAAQRSATAAEQDFQSALSIFNQTITAQYESTAVSATGALLSSDSGQNYLDRISSMGLLSANRAQRVQALNAIKSQAQAARTAAAKLLAATQAKRAGLAKQRAQIAADTAKYETLFATMSAAAQEAYRKMGAATPEQINLLKSASDGLITNPKVKKVVDFAWAQVGKPYVVDTEGPATFDCSGLSMAAWALAGIQLPHFAATQYDYGTHVSVNQLQPGDLIFLYSPIDHVEIYVGFGLAVSAADPELGVRVVNIQSEMSDWSGATHLM